MLYDGDPYLLQLRDPRVLAWKKRNTEWGQYALTLPLLAKTRGHQVSVECAASGV